MGNNELLSFDEFSMQCDYFYCYDGDTNFNNGYNCNHPECEEIQEDDDGTKVGCCHSWACPLQGQFSYDDDKEE